MKDAWGDGHEAGGRGIATFHFVWHTAEISMPEGVLRL